MKSLKSLSCVALLLLFFSCENMDSGNTGAGKDSTLNTQNSNDTIVVLHDRVKREKSEYRANTQREIDSTQNYINRMDEKMENAGAKAKQEWQETKKRLQPKLDRAKADLNEFGNKADNEWDNFRANVKANLDSLREISKLDGKNPDAVVKENKK